MADEHIPMEFYTDDTIAVDLGEVMAIGGSSVSVNANYNQTNPNAPDYIIGRENIQSAINIGSAYIYDLGDVWYDAKDVTDTITYKPTMAESYPDCYKPMSFIAENMGSGTGDGYVFHNDYVFWDYHSLGFEMYFHTFTATGEKKVVKLVYEYDDYETSPPRSITAYLVETPTIGDIETALDGIIAIQEALIGGDSV